MQGGLLLTPCTFFKRGNIMAFCTEEQVRNSNKKFSNVDEVLRTVVTERIAQAEKVITMDLSSVISSADLQTIGANSEAVNLLAIYKSTELLLVTYYGAGRKIDEVSDISYFKKEYQTLLDRVLKGDIKLSVNSTDYSPKSYPSLDHGINKKFYVRKGVVGFTPDGENFYGQTYVDEDDKG